MSDELSAGIISFEIKGYSTPDAVKELNEKKVVATASPYKTSWVQKFAKPNSCTYICNQSVSKKN
jgi:selenocysteine lyase/cysteine desulfurase